MSRLRPLALAAAVVLALCALPAGAAATSAKLSPIADCKAHNGTLTQTYTLAQLEKALKQLSPSETEYTICNATISNAINADLGTKVKVINPPGSGSGGGGSGTVILIVVIIVVILVGGGGALWAYRRNRAAGPDTGAGG
jgi:hypothetical protein